jgi:uncharacterized protein
MGKLALLAIVVIAALLWLRYKADSDARAERKPGKAPVRPRVENMIQCAHCGVHLPSGEALVDDAGAAYCNAAHRNAGRRAP